MAEMTKRQPIEVINQWLHSLETEGHGLTTWEEEFITDLQSQVDETGTLSERQEQLLETLYANKTP